MAFQHIKDVEIVGLAACVPSGTEENKDLDLFAGPGEYKKFVETTGVERRRLGGPGICASDLCCQAAERLIKELKWKKEEIDCLVFVSGTPDYVHPATACILQARLGLSSECMAFDISLECSGWVYGISTIASLISAGTLRKALLLAGDTVNVNKHPKLKNLYPLFGDAGTATALVHKEGARGIMAHLATDGGNYRTIIMEDGGARNPFNEESLKVKEYEPGVHRTRLHICMDGMSVFSFGITKPPKSVKALLERFRLDKDEVDYFVFHQANQMLNDTIGSKLRLPQEKTPGTLKDFGNTSTASIPLTMVLRMKDAINHGGGHRLNVVACGFGAGLSWGSVFFELNNVYCCDLIEIQPAGNVP